MSKRALVGLTVLILALTVAGLGLRAAPPQDDNGTRNTANHPAVGSYFGRATQLCAPGAPCPQIALFMTPTLTGDGIFIGNDSLSLGSAPFGPHTTAHGQWIPTSKTGFIADYTFMLPSYAPLPPFLPPPPPPAPQTVSALRFRWLANAIKPNTIVGYVNIYLNPPIPVEWEAVAADEFPPLPDEATPIITSPAGVVTDPSTCATPGCPLVFKFTVKRVAP
jgi:hypothetical protein